ETPFGFDGGTILTITLKHEMRHSSRNLGHFRLSVTSAENLRLTDVPARLRPLLDVPVDKRTPAETKDLAAIYRQVAPLLDPTRERLKQLNQSLEDLH